MPPFLSYGAQYIDDDDVASVAQVLKSGWLTTGPSVELFEQRLCNATGAKHAIVVSNGTTALHLAYLGLGLKPGHVVIVPAITFLATANAAIYCGAEVIFADVDPSTGLMEAQHVTEALKRVPTGKKVHLITPVHLNGQGCDMADLKRVADQHNIHIVEDACHALGSECAKGQKIGSCDHSQAAVFSFHPVKTIAMGEGGAIVCQDDKLAEAMRRARSHGMVGQPINPINPSLGLDASGNPNPWYYEMPEMGYNYRASDLHCALGASQLLKLSHFIERRRELVNLYREALQDLAPFVQTIKEKSSWKPAWHIFPVRIDFAKAGIDRAQVMHALKEQGIGSQVHYIPVPWQPFYQKHCQLHSYSGAQSYYESAMSLPLHLGMRDEDVGRIINTLREILGL